MTLYQSLKPVFQDWVDSAVEMAEDAQLHRYADCIPWFAVFLGALKQVSSDVRMAFASQLKDGLSFEDYSLYVQSLVNDLRHSKKTLECVDEEFDEGGRTWLRQLGSVSEENTGVAGLIALLDCPDEAVGAELRKFFFIDKVRGRLEDMSGPKIGTSDLFDAEGLLREDYFTKHCWSVLEAAADRAGKASADFLLPVHVLSAILESDETAIENALRINLPVQTSFETFREYIRSHMSVIDEKHPPCPLAKGSLSTILQEKILIALGGARSFKEKRVNTKWLFIGLLDRDEEKYKGIVAAFFKNHQCDVSRIISVLKTSSVASGDPPLQIPEFLAGRDLSYDAEHGKIAERLECMPPAGGSGAAEQKAAEGTKDGRTILDAMLEVLYRRQCNSVVVLAHEGTGRTTLLDQLALKMTSPEIAHFWKKRLVSLECARISPDGRKGFLQLALEFVYAKKNVILALDGLETIFVGDEKTSTAGSAFIEQLQHALYKNNIQLVITISPPCYHAVFSHDQRIAQLFETITVKEPQRDIMERIRESIVADIKKRYDSDITAAAVTKALQLCEQYMPAYYFPKKFITVLERAADSKCFVCEKGSAGTAVTADDVVAVVSKTTGIPEETLRGDTGGIKYDVLLGQAVVGQDNAVNICARELGLIKSGMKDPDKPASVLLFAGMTGTGKTELAKAIAGIYSASKRLVTFTMGNFSESHAISGLIGSPPGYIGYDQGGPLINEINRDPYCVVLLDEIEKAHPEIWKPFLNLFDEAWIVDSRNVRAQANRCIFILTSNVGADKISELYGQNASPEEIQKAVKQELYDVCFRDTNQRCFTPEFLARIQQIVVFRPLDEKALAHILDIQIERKKTAFMKSRDKILELTDEVKAALAKECASRYRMSMGKVGGREGKKLIIEYIDGLIQACPQEEFRNAVKIIIEGSSLDTLSLKTVSRPIPREYAVENIQKAAATMKEHIEMQTESAIRNFEQRCRPYAEALGRASIRIPDDEMSNVKSAVVETVRKLVKDLGG